MKRDGDWVIDSTWIPDADHGSEATDITLPSGSIVAMPLLSYPTQNQAPAILPATSEYQPTDELLLERIVGSCSFYWDPNGMSSNAKGSLSLGVDIFDSASDSPLPLVPLDYLLTSPATANRALLWTKTFPVYRFSSWTVPETATSSFERSLDIDIRVKRKLHFPFKPAFIVQWWPQDPGATLGRLFMDVRLRSYFTRPGR